MKKTSTLLLLCSLVLNGFAQINLQLGIVAYYPMNNSLVDSSANNFDLTAYGFPVGSTDRHGSPDGAYRLSNLNPDYFTAPFDPLLAPAEITVSAWINFPNTFNDQKIVGRAEVGAGYLMGLDTNKIDAEIWDQAGTHFRLKSDQVQPNTWTHLAMSFKANDYLKVYINGNPVDSIPTGVYGVAASAFWPLTIGAAPWQTTALNADGSIDDIYIYNRALSNEEVYALFSDPTAVPLVKQQNLFSVYPVPSTDGMVTVQMKSPLSEDLHIQVSDAIGRTVHKNILPAGSMRMTFDLSSLQNGLYCIKIAGMNAVGSKRIVIE